jgi:HSP20 family molecular chaperone IbpA
MRTLSLLDHGLFDLYPNLGMSKMSYDVQENEDKIVFSMAVPGMVEEDIDARIKDGRKLVIKSKRETTFMPQFSYAFQLPCYVVKKDTQASIKNGVLTIVMVKSEEKDFKVDF